jgi:hypothetical protein
VWCREDFWKVTVMDKEISSKQISPRQLEANRENAKKSTGPRTAEGKLVSRRNALKHGLYTKDLVIRSGQGKENPREFQQLFENLRKDLQPEGQLEELQVVKIAIAHWQLRRALRAEAGEIVNSFVKEEQLELSAVASHRNIPGGEAATRILHYQMACLRQEREAFDLLERLQQRRHEQEQVSPPEAHEK